MVRRKNISDPRLQGQLDSALEADVQSMEIYDDASTGISQRTLKRAGRFMWLSIIFFILTIFCVAGFVMMYNSSMVNRQRSCWVEQQKIEALAERYVEANGFSSFPAYVEDVPTFTEVFVECPSGGKYTWNPITGEYSCSEHGHYPEGFNQAQSINKGTTTVMIEAKS